MTTPAKTREQLAKAPWADDLPPLNPVLDPSRSSSPQADTEGPEYPVEGDVLIIWFDGSARPNPGLAGFGIVVIDAGRVIHEESVLLNPDQLPTPLTNNQAEMYGLERALQIAKAVESKYTGKRVEIRTDSLLAANTYNGAFKAKLLKPEYERCKAIGASPAITVVQIPEVDPRHCGRVDYLAGIATGTYIQ